MTCNLKASQSKNRPGVNLIIHPAHPQKPAAGTPGQPPCLFKPNPRLNSPAPAPGAAPFDWNALLPRKPMFRVPEVAAMFDCSRDHVYNLLDEGILRVAVDIRTPAARRGCTRILRDSLIEFLQRADLASRITHKLTPRPTPQA